MDEEQQKSAGRNRGPRAPTCVLESFYAPKKNGVGDGDRGELNSPRKGEEARGRQSANMDPKDFSLGGQ